MGQSISSPVVAAVLAGVSLYILWRIYGFLSYVFWTPLRTLPGPPTPSWTFGNLKEIDAVPDSLVPQQWFEKYGKNFVDRDFFMWPRLWTIDPRALQHILTRAYDYPRPEENRKMFKDVLGRGILLIQGEKHRQQRRVLNPAFGPAQVRDLTHIFVEKSIELRDLWLSNVRGGPTRINVIADLSRATLDIIGLAGFGYDFNSLNPKGKPSELSAATRGLFQNSPRISSLSFFLQQILPVLKLIRNKRVTAVYHAAAVLRSAGQKLVAEKKAAILRDASEKHLNGVERKDVQGRDLLTLLIKANMAKDIPDNQRLSDEDVMGQIPTFLLAGHETTSLSSSWALYALARNQAAQKKLREELLAVETENPTMEELSALPYLDNVVRETLRLHSPVAMLVRAAEHDDVIPLSEPFIDRYGKVQHEIKIGKGNRVIIPVIAIQRSKEIWGDDAMEFRPERWDQPPEAAAAIPGVWGHLLSFIGGPRACIGYRFALVELKAILFVLIRAFEYELAVPAEDVVAKTAPAQRPSLRSAPDQGHQLPLLVKEYTGA